jgi:hypothetical protein
MNGAVNFPALSLPLLPLTPSIQFRVVCSRCLAAQRRNEKVNFRFINLSIFHNAAAAAAMIKEAKVNVNAHAAHDT